MVDSSVTFDLSVIVSLSSTVVGLLFIEIVVSESSIADETVLSTSFVSSFASDTVVVDDDGSDIVWLPFVSNCMSRFIVFTVLTVDAIAFASVVVEADEYVPIDVPPLEVLVKNSVVDGLGRDDNAELKFRLDDSIVDNGEIVASLIAIVLA